MAKNVELQEYLRTRRARVQPADVGIETDGRRRVPGLRREEVAMLAGISLDYYARLEQGRDLQPSDQVLDAIARALRLAEVERGYLHSLVRSTVATPTPEELEIAPIDDGMRPMLDSLEIPALIIDLRGDVHRDEPHGPGPACRTRAASRSGGQPPALGLPRAGNPPAVRRLGDDRPGERRSPARGRGPLSPRQGAARANRRAVRRQPRVPQLVGRARRRRAAVVAASASTTPASGTSSCTPSRCSSATGSYGSTPTPRSPGHGSAEAIGLLGTWAATEEAAGRLPVGSVQTDLERGPDRAESADVGRGQEIDEVPAHALDV